jgi:methionyl-tRNA synthetase
MTKQQIIGRLHRIFKSILNGYQIDFELFAETLMELHETPQMPDIVTPDIKGQIELPFEDDNASQEP